MNGNSSRDPVSFLAEFNAPELLDLLADGAYITGTERRIVLWNQAAQRITGWGAEEVVGRCCRENILVHVDKDGHALCGHEHCPLHRGIVTGQPSAEPFLVFAQHRSGNRIPVEVTGSPVRDCAGRVIGGIEMFRGLTGPVQDQLRAKAIQELAIRCDLPEDDRVSFETRYQPPHIVGRDFSMLRNWGTTTTPFWWLTQRATAWRPPCIRRCCGRCARSTAGTWPRRPASWAL